MYKIIAGFKLAALFLCFNTVGQEIKSPSEFLGYPLGSKFTYHHKVVDYYNYIAGLSDKVDLQPYGETYERRELFVVFISAPQNLQQIERIRENNLRRTGLMKGDIHENEIAIVWLSYNVHGNEANSTETSMQVLYELAVSNKDSYDTWLDNLIIVIDPCLNPDGRDRYVHWYNQVAGLSPNPNINVREHHEDWTHGRTNHYLFDLNRDWVWQTQSESQQRLLLYNKWMPHVHVDFHEQGLDDNYYFAPAAEPMHELITPWQRDFQEIIGKNNAKYFDEKGWLYFTRERFDLLYPGYGDTYPTYNGAIGMTYEMAGHSLAGLAVITGKGDTLTLRDRIDMHFTTTMATIEASYENRKRLIDEFAKFFKPLGNDHYILKSAHADRLTLLAELLEKNKIEYGTPGSKSIIKATSYDNSDAVSIEINPGDLIVPLRQPKSTMVKILFEKDTRLADTLTYDITAWSLPYVYGVEGFHTTAKLSLAEFIQAMPVFPEKDGVPPYGYLLNWTSVKDAEFLSQILQVGIKVNYFTQKFTYNSMPFSEGTLLINRIDNQHINDLENKIKKEAEKLNRSIVPLYSGSAIASIDLGSSKIRYLKKPRVVMLAGKGISTYDFGELWYFFEQEIKMPLDIIHKQSVSQIDLNEYDIIILPSGHYESLTDEEGFGWLDTWIKNGGKLILIENAIDGFVGEGKFAIEKHKDDKSKDEDESTDPVLYPYSANERENLKNYIQGGIIKLELDNTHPLAYGYDNNYHTLKTNSVGYNYLKDGWNVGYINSEKSKVAGFVGAKSKEKLNKNLVIGVEQRGRGKVVYFADDPMFRSFWQNGKLFMANAIFFDN
jgi:hypothetical protein